MDHEMIDIEKVHYIMQNEIQMKIWNILRNNDPETDDDHYFTDHMMDFVKWDCSVYVFNSWMIIWWTL